MERAPLLPLEVLRTQAPAGPWSYRAIYRAGGPCPEVTAAAERTGVMRDAPIRRLASVLLVPEATIRAALDATRAEVAAAKPDAEPEPEDLFAWAKRRLGAHAKRGAS